MHLPKDSYIVLHALPFSVHRTVQCHASRASYFPKDILASLRTSSHARVYVFVLAPLLLRWDACCVSNGDATVLS